MRYQFQAAGYSGGFFNLFNDTEAELQSAAITALRQAGFGVGAVVVEADEWDASARILHNTFHYRLTATLESAMPATTAIATFTRTIEGLAGSPATVSNIGAGDTGQQLPDSNPIPELAGVLGIPLGIIAVILVAVAVIVLKVEA
jgi:hypothetical protein